MKLKLLINKRAKTHMDKYVKSSVTKESDYCFPVELSVEIKEEKGNLISYIQLHFS